MELLVSAKLAHSKFHGIPWNFSCQRNWRTPSSMEFHGIPWNCSSHRNWRTQSPMEFHGTAIVIEIGALLVPWNSMELLVSAKLAHRKFHGIPWNSMELLVSAKLAHYKFHGIPWNCSSHRNWRTQSSLEFHETALVIEIGALLVPWNSMEQLVSAKLAHSKFHGIPWNSMELLVSAKLAHSKFHGIPWNSMELLESSKLAHPKFHGIPWNCSCHRNWRTTSSMEFHGTSRVSEIGAF